MVNYCYRDLKKIEILKEFASHGIPIFAIVLLIITLAITCIVFIISGDLYWEAPLSIFLYLIALLILDYMIGIDMDDSDDIFSAFLIPMFLVGMWGGYFAANIWSWFSSGPISITYKDCGIVSFVLALLQIISTLFCIWKEQKNSIKDEVQNEKEEDREIDPLHISDDGKCLMWCNRDASSCIIPEGIEEIKDEAFRGCSNLRFLTIPDSVKSIGKGAFQATGIINMKLPDHIARIEERTFAVCRKLEKIEIPNTVEIICYEAFNSCDSLKQIVIPSSVKEIESHAISGCANLKEVVIESFPIKIHKWAFYDCRELVQIILAAPMYIDYSWAFKCSEYLHFVLSHGKGKLI